MINDAELADLRTFVLDALPDTCEIIRATVSAPDINGDTTETWNTVSVEPCAFVPHDVQPSERPTGGVALVGESLWHIRLRANVDINPRDRILQLVPVSRTFEVISVRAPRSREIFRIVICTLLT